jgi:hypothetical protein
LIISAGIRPFGNKDEKKEIQISSTTHPACEPQKDEKPSGSGPSLPAHFFSKPKPLQMF